MADWKSSRAAPRRTRSAVALKAAAAALLIAAAGCTSPAFRESVGQFGTLTKAGVAAQNQRLAAITAAEQERIRAELASGQVDLRLARTCADTVTSQAPGPAAECRLVRADGQPLEVAVSFENARALSAALTNYADSLIALAADPAQDQRAFTASINNLGTSLGRLEGEVRQATNAPADNSRAQIGAVAAVVAEAGNLYFGYRRSRALRRIILRADPIVQDAVGTLVQLQLRVRQYQRAPLMEQVRLAQSSASAAAHASPPDPAALRAAQNTLFDRLAAYNATGADVEKFVAIGEAHAGLTRAAQEGASPEQMAAAIQAILHLAGTIHASAETLSGDNGSD